MDVDKYQSIADGIRSKYAILEDIPGSGFHDNDRNHVNQTLFTAPQKNGLCRASENLVYFTDRDEEVVYFFGSDAERAYELILKWTDSFKRVNMANAPGTARNLYLRLIPKVSVKDGVLAIWLCDWNDFHWLLVDEMRVGMTGNEYP